MNRFLRERLEELLEDVSSLERKYDALRADYQRLEIELDLAREALAGLDESCPRNCRICTGGQGSCGAP